MIHFDQLFSSIPRNNLSKHVLGLERSHETSRRDHLQHRQQSQLQRRVRIPQRISPKYLFVSRLVEFKCREDMDRAIDELDDTKLDGRRIRLVEESRDRSASRSRSKSSSRSRSRSPRRSKSGSRSKSKSKSRSRSPDKEDRFGRQSQKSPSRSRSRS